LIEGGTEQRIDGERQAQQEQDDEPAQQIRGVINTIRGGFSHGGLSSQSQKRYLHAIKDIDVNCVDMQSPRSLPPITFTYKDFKGINTINQDNPIVVSIVIANFMGSRVLID